MPTYSGPSGYSKESAAADKKRRELEKQVAAGADAQEPK